MAQDRMYLYCNTCTTLGPVVGREGRKWEWRGGESGKEESCSTFLNEHMANCGPEEWADRARLLASGALWVTLTNENGVVFDKAKKSAPQS